ncbi:GumC family protein [Hydrogenimonas urashimensis]|uniref:GumC family protein n=1 Tax=Hydrogenimonas urashimensis TaxID=2740515 RepID=UPI001916C108|nr:polysaccharide biosynthesis tyrosine autokinase [Hydrogenimonas urashimensis]
MKNSASETDLKEFFTIIRRYRYLIVSITLVSIVLAVIYSYFAPKMYKTSSLIEINTEGSRSQPDILSLATGASGSSIENEIEIIQSRKIILDALQNLNIGTRYYTVKNFKTKELYKNSPFVVNADMLTENAKRSTFQLYPVSEESFKLVIKPSLKEKIINFVMSYFKLGSKNEEPIVYEKVHKYGEQIETPWFSIVVQKIFQPKNEKYFFSIRPNEEMKDYIVNNLKVNSISPKATMVTVSFEDRVGMRAKDILDAVINAYINETLKLKTESEEKKLKFIDSQLASISKTLQASASRLQQYKATHVVTSVGEKATLTAEKLSELQSQLYEIDMRLGVFQNILQFVKTHEDIKGIDIDLAQQLSPTINALILKIQEANELRSSLLTEYTELHPDVVRVTKKLRSLRISLLAALKSAIRSLQDRKQRLLGIINENEQKLKQLPEQERQLARLTRSFMVNEKIYSYLLQKRAETAIAASSTLPRARVVDEPYVPKKPFKPIVQLIVLIGGILGFMLSMAIALIRYRMDDTIKSSKELEKLTHLPLYGAIPFLSGRKNLSTFHEALRVVRTNLEFLQNTGKSKLVTITSTIPKEGKTTISTELAKIIAKSGKRVIIVDLDMRQSKVHKMFNLPNKEGLSTLLAGKNTLKEVIQKTNEDNLYVITSGPKPPDPSELLMSDAFKKLIEKLLSEYDYVLLDSPPIGLVTDAMIAMRMSDINLVVVRAEYSKREFVKNINHFAKEHEIKVGIIINALKVSSKKGAYGYGYGVSYGYNNNYYS